jgi:hypothetical protein
MTKNAKNIEYSEANVKLPNSSNSQIASLIELSVKGLISLYDEKQGLFAFYIKDNRKIPMPLGWSICYTAITLLGLHKVHPSQLNTLGVINQQKSLHSLVANWKNADKFGHLGLIQWANAECEGQYSNDVTYGIAKGTSEDNSRRLPTTELAWLLTGICATYQHLHADDMLRELAFYYFKALTNNFNPQTGLFRHSATKTNLRSHIGNFADQIYSVFALSLFYEVFNHKQALVYAEQCADCLCSLQGREGQWWWHYHSRHGVVSFPYPVFSVHQDGMGPMGLQKLSSVSGKNFDDPIYMGLDWLFGSNELGLEMIDWERNLIWRDIETSSLASVTRYISFLLAETGLVSSSSLKNSGYVLKLNYEIRPYELGWLLYAFAGLPGKQETNFMGKGSQE